MIQSTNDPLISILMPAKNAAAFLRECVQSILQQSYSKWELIVVNDHSSDDTNNILLQFCDLDERIHVIQNIEHGIIPALQLAYRQANGIYITRMDADDIMTPNKLALLSNGLIKYGKGFIAVGGVHYFSAKGIGEGYSNYAKWLNELTIKSANFSEIYKECVIPSPCWLIHRTDLDACGAFDSNIYPEDYDLCFRFYKAGYKIVGVNQILHHWRDYDSRSSRTDPNYADNRFLELKTKYFVEIDYINNHSLVLWGAGKKGKRVARDLIDRNISFSWITNNNKKIGREIYGQTIASTTNYIFSSENQLIITVANRSEQLDILDSIKSAHQPPSMFWFC